MKGEIKIALIGLDSSHGVEFTRLLHDSNHRSHVPGGRIVAAFPGGSRDWPPSMARLDEFCGRMLTEFAIPLAASIEEAAAAADAIMILSMDGRVHAREFEAVAKFGKPVYVDKPMSISPAEVKRMEAVAQRTGTRLFSASVWRFSRGLAEARAALGDGGCRHAHLHGQWPLEEGRQGWFFYGIHQVEMLFAAMGLGCRCVACTRDEVAEVITGYWPAGRIGTIATNHNEQRAFGGWLLGENDTTLMEVKDTKHERYNAFLQATLAFFRGGDAPVPLNETLETIAFMTAAELSANQHGVPAGLNPQYI